jgi:hypothetical protein
MGNSWNNNYGFQLAHAFHGDGFAVRRVTNGSFASWRTIIDSGNIGSQSVSYANTAGSVAWTNVSSRPTALSQFTNDLGNYGGWITSSGSISGNAATATNVAWTGVTGRPTALSQFTNDLGNYGGFLTSLGFSYSTGVTGNHVVQRDANGYIYANHINFNTGESENPTISSFITSNGDGWSRKSSLAHVRSQLGLGSMAYESTGTYQTASGAINTGNIGSQSVNYANYSGYSNLVSVPDWRDLNYQPNQFAGNRVGFHFNNTSTLGGNSDFWMAVQTVSPWSSYDASHRQQQLLWGGSGGLSFRYATSATTWSGWSRIYSDSYRPYADSAGSATTAGSATSASQLTKYGDIYGQDWNSYYLEGKFIAAAVYGMSGANKPPTSYDYGVALSYGESTGPRLQWYFPENQNNIGTIFRKGTYRTGWNGNWSNWKTLVEQEGNLCTIVGGNGTGLEVHGNVGYNQDPLTYFLIRGQADTSWKAVKIRLTGDAGGQDIEFRRIAENGADSRMWYVPRGGNTVNFEYPIVQPSDSRLKDNITPISTPVEKIKALSGVEFDWNSGEQVGTHDVGLIAQDVEAVLPEAVTTQEDGYKNLAYTKVIPLLVEAMKEQQTMIEALRAEIELLKNK